MPAARDNGGGGGSSVVTTDAADLRSLGRTADAARDQIETVQRTTGTTIGGLDRRGWDAGAVDARWAGVRSSLTTLASDLALQALDLATRAMWVEAFESAGFGSAPDGTPLQDPVNSASGNLVHTEVDLILPCRGDLPLRLARTYNSRDSAIGSFGPGWASSLDCQILDCGDIGAVVRREDGRRDAFALDDDGGYSAPMGVRDTLVRERSGWRLTSADGGVLRFGPSGHLLAMDDRNASSLTFARDAHERVVGLTDAFGRGLYFEYLSDRLVAASDSADRSWRYVYSDTGYLTEATDPLGNTVRYAYEGGRLASITDPLGRRTLANVYDDLGRVLEQTNGEGAISRFAYAEHTTTLVDPRGNTVHLRHDARGLVTEIVDALGQTLRYTYTECGNRASVTDRTGQTWTYAYNGQCRLAEVQDPLGATSHFSYDEHGNVVQRTDPLGFTWTFAYDDRQNLVGFTNPVGATTTFERDAFGQITRVVDPDGVAVRYAYDDAGLMTDMRSHAGETRFEYDVAGRLIAATDASDAVTRWTYDPRDRPTSAQNALGGATHWQYDAAGQLVATVDPRGQQATFAYDRVGRSVHVVDPLGGRFVLGYDANGNQTEMQDPGGHTQRLEYDQLDRPIALTDPRGGTWRRTYDANGNVVELTDARGATLRSVFDAAGRLVEWVDRAGGRTRCTLDAAGNVVAAIDPTGAETRFAYDPVGRPTRRTDALGGQNELVWTPGGRLAEVVDGHGHRVKADYDAAGRLARVTYADGSQAHAGYDAAGNLAFRTDPSGATTTFAYDALRRLVRRTDARGQTVELDYDARGALSEVRQADGEVRTRYEYDALGHLVAVLDAESNITRYTYDPRGLLRAVVDARGHRRGFEFDANGWLAESVDGLGRRTRFDHDPNGNWIGQTDPAGRQLALEYDPEGRPTLVQTSDGQRIQAAYDAAGRWTSLSSPLGAQSQAYDALGRVIRSVDPLGRTTEITYDVEGFRTGLRYPGGAEVRFNYDSADRLHEVHDQEAGAWRLTYGPEGLPQATELPNGRRWETRRDALGRLVELRGPSGTFTYTYDSRDNIVAAVENGRRTAYAYDALARLIAVQGPAGETRFAYDAAGNRISTTTPDGRVTRASYDAADQLTALEQAGAPVARFSYDERGNLIERTASDAAPVTYQWDDLGHLVGAGLASFAYDALGVLQREQRGDDVRDYVQDLTLPLPRVLTASDGQSTTRFVYGLGPLAAVDEETNGVGYVGVDIRGSVRGVADERGQTLAARDYDAWGVPVGPALSPLGFTGEPQEPGTDLVYLRARWYDPSTGRMLGRDPLPGMIAAPLSLNPYAYALDNPVSRRDPSGLSSSSAPPLPGGGFPGPWPFGQPPFPLPAAGPTTSPFGPFGPLAPSTPGGSEEGWRDTHFWPPGLPEDPLSALLGGAGEGSEARLRYIEGLYKKAGEFSQQGRAAINRWAHFYELANTPSEHWLARLPFVRDVRAGVYTGMSESALEEGTTALSRARALRATATGLEDAAPWARGVARGAPIVGAGIDFGFSGYDQWNHDKDLPTPERATRTAVKGAATAAGAYGGAAVMGTVCAPAGATGIGAILVVGCGAAGAYVGGKVGGMAGDAINWGIHKLFG